MNAIAVAGQGPGASRTFIDTRRDPRVSIIDRFGVKSFEI